MSRNEFLKKLREALQHSLTKEDINYQLDYYDKYISDEVAKGRTEKEVVEELGDPMLIAKTIKTVSGSDNVVDVEPVNESDDNNQNNRRTYVYRTNNSVFGCVIAFLLMFIIGVFLFRVLILSAIFGLFFR